MATEIHINAYICWIHISPKCFPKMANIVQLRCGSGVRLKLSTLVERPSRRLVNCHTHESGYSFYHSSWPGISHSASL